MYTYTLHIWWNDNTFVASKFDWKLLHFRFNVGFSDGKVKLESPAILSPPLSLQCPMWKVGLGKRTEERFPDSRKSNAALSPSSSSLTGGRLSRSGTAEDRSTGLREPPRDTTDRPLLPKRPPCCHSTTLITTQTCLPPPSLRLKFSQGPPPHHEIPPTGAIKPLTSPKYHLPTYDAFSVATFLPGAEVEVRR